MRPRIHAPMSPCTSYGAPLTEALLMSTPTRTHVNMCSDRPLQDGVGMSALMKAADGGHREAVEVLLSAGGCAAGIVW